METAIAFAKFLFRRFIIIKKDHDLAATQAINNKQIAYDAAKQCMNTL